jgi:hypothetical protein
MTLKEKAEELVNKFSHFTVQEKWELKNYYAIECALIAINREIESLIWLNLLCTFKNPIKVDIKNKIKELKEIKQEIELL